MDPIAYLFSLEALGIKFGLENIRALCRALGEPQQRYPSVIVAGTNGKGSVAAMAAAALQAAGRRAGRYTSPHLVRLEERFAVDGRPVATARLREAAADVREAIVRLRRDGVLETVPTFFEATTAVAFELFRRAEVDIAVLEVGLGGRLDATNVVTPLAAAITSIDLDHQALLGSTLREIAREKAGVIKPGGVVVAGRLADEARETVAAAAAARGARLVDAWEGTRLDTRLAGGATVLTIETRTATYGPLTLGLRGRHQAENAVTAVRLLETLDGLGLPVSRRAVEAGLSGVSWPGRLELLPWRGAAVLLDAAHNPAGARALAAYLREAEPGGVPVVFGVMRDKDAEGMLRALAPVARTLVLTRPPGPRGAEVEALAACARRAAPGVPATVEPAPLAALARALQTGSPACVTGSIVLVGEVRETLAAAADGPRPVGRTGTP